MPVYDPRGHGLQAELEFAPDSGEAVPAGQATQVLLRDAPHDSEKKPAGHFVHASEEEAELPSEYVPGGHALQASSEEDCPLNVEYVPARASCVLNFQLLHAVFQNVTNNVLLS